MDRDQRNRLKFSRLVRKAGGYPRPVRSDVGFPGKWGKIVGCILGELNEKARLLLIDPRLEVRTLLGGAFYMDVYAHFPMHRNRVIAKTLRPRPETRVLLVFNIAAFGEAPEEVLKDRIRDHLGHALLYLRRPKARNECSDAEREWRASVKPSMTAATSSRGSRPKQQTRAGR